MCKVQNNRSLSGKMLVAMLVFSTFSTAEANDLASKDTKAPTFFAAFEIGEAVFNDFQSLSGEVGWKFRGNQLLRFTHMNVELTEQHLSSSFAGAVDGDNVEGSFYGFEVFYDLPVFGNSLYVGPSIGYYKNEFRHTLSDDKVNTQSLTVGAAISYRETELLKIEGLYYTVSFPMRYSFRASDEVVLGDATIKSNEFDNNIWLFLGYEF